MQPCARSQTHAARANFTLERNLQGRKEGRNARIASHSNRLIHLPNHSWDFLKVCGSFWIGAPEFPTQPPRFRELDSRFCISVQFYRSNWRKVDESFGTCSNSALCRPSWPRKLKLDIFSLEKARRSGKKTTNRHPPPRVSSPVHDSPRWLYSETESAWLMQHTRGQHTERVV